VITPAPDCQGRRVHLERRRDSEGQSAGPDNQAPVVDAGPDQTITLPAAATLNGTVTDDGLPPARPSPSPGAASAAGTVTFANANAASTTATFPSMATMSASERERQPLSSSATVRVTANPASGGGCHRIRAAWRLRSTDRRSGREELYRVPLHRRESNPTGVTRERSMPVAPRSCGKVTTAARALPGVGSPSSVVRSLARR